MGSHRPAITTDTTASRVALLGGTALVLGVVAAGMWFVWLGWDREYYRVDGVRQGPYQTWQVVGCGLSLAAAAVFSYLCVRGVWAIFVLAAAADIGFALPWALHAASSADSGLWLVGLVFLLGGAGIGLLLVLGLTAAAVTRPLPRLQGGDSC